MDLNQVTLPSIDVPTSMAFYARLGLRLVVDSAPRYVRFALPAGRSTLSLHEAASVTQPTGVVIYFESASAAELDARCAALAADGIVFDQLPRDGELARGHGRAGLHVRNRRRRRGHGARLLLGQRSTRPGVGGGAADGGSPGAR